jgi:phage FluMu protein Com
MQIRCYRCNWSFAIKQDEIEFVLKALEESGDTHYDVRCTRCRHVNKVSIDQLRRGLPRGQEES